MRPSTLRSPWCSHVLLLIACSLLHLYLQAPFTILKAGPTRVEQNAPFNFEVTVVFMSSVTAARIVDNLPPGLWPTGTATWTAISNNGVPSGSECGLLCVFHNSHSMWWPAVRT